MATLEATPHAWGNDKDGSVPTIGLLIIPLLLISAAFLFLQPQPVAAASQCSSNGGYTYYYAAVGDTGSSAYGVGANTTMSSWTFNTPVSEGHQLWYVDMSYSTGNWVQMGYGIGTLDGTSASSIELYYEYGIGGSEPYYAFLSGYPIPAGDHGYAEVWTTSQSGGDWYAEAKGYSPYYSISWSITENVGSSNKEGTVSISTEAEYATPYSGNCDVYGQYNYSRLPVYTTSASTSEPKSVGTLWSTCSTYNNAPYSVYVPYCYGSGEFWGGS